MRMSDAVLDRLTPSLLLPLHRRMTRDRAHILLPEVVRINAGTRDEIASHQLARIRAICDIAARETEFYADRFRNAGIKNPAQITLDELRKIPLLTRDDLRDQAARIMNSRFAPHELRESATGGTTDAPVRIYMDWACLYHRRAATIAFDRWFGYEPGNRVAYLWGAAQDFQHLHTWKGRLRNALLNRARFYPASQLDETTMHSYYEDLRSFCPVLLQAYPSALEVFSRFMVRNHLSLTIPAVCCTAESLSPEQKQIIGKAFGRAPYDWYGSRECGRVATEKPGHQGLHVNAYGLYVELVGNFQFESVSYGSIVITDLWNEGFPLIRYDTRDLGTFVTQPSVGGGDLPRLATIAGRAIDCFMNSRGQWVRGTANGILGGCHHVKQIQVTQVGIREFEIILVPDAGYTPSSEAMLRQALDSLMDEQCRVTIVKVEQVPAEPSGKRRLTKNLMKIAH